jgi:hypothetical protein
MSIKNFKKVGSAILLFTAFNTVQANTFRAGLGAEVGLGLGACKLKDEKKYGDTKLSNGFSPMFCGNAMFGYNFGDEPIARISVYIPIGYCISFYKMTCESKKLGIRLSSGYRCVGFTVGLMTKWNFYILDTLPDSTYFLRSGLQYIKYGSVEEAEAKGTSFETTYKKCEFPNPHNIAFKLGVGIDVQGTCLGVESSIYCLDHLKSSGSAKDIMDMTLGKGQFNISIFAEYDIVKYFSS